MKILHITDFHFRNDESSKQDQNKMIKKLCEDLTGQKIDIIFFTGDLVNKGNKIEYFNTASKDLIENIQTTLKLDKTNIFICGGNHDLHREQELNAIKTEIDKIKSQNELNDFITIQNGRQFKESVKNLENFIEYQNNFYTEHKILGDEIESLYSIHKRKIQGINIGITTINTGWRCFNSKIDRGNLIYPISFVKKSLNKLKNDSEFNILLMHHPISDLKYWNASDFEDVVFDGYHMLFSGHVHKRKHSAHVTYDEGIFCCVSPAALSLYENHSKVGYSLLDVNLETYEIEILNKVYDKQDNVFLSPKDIIKADIPLHGDKRNQNEFRKTVRKRLNEETNKANDLFLSANEDESSSFLELFTNPIIKNKSKAELASKKEDTLSSNLEEIIFSNDNYLIYGKDKSGKTSFLYKSLLDLLRNFSSTKIIPFYIDSKEYIKNQKTLDISRLLTQYYEVSKSKLDGLLSKYTLKLLIDNYDPNNSNFNSELNKFLEEQKNVSFMAITEDSMMKQYELIEFDGQAYSKLFIHEISRNEVRSLTNKWPNIETDRKELILDKINQIFIQLNIPMNYWTVSLFLWIFEKTNDANFHNNFELIQLYIDNLLDRKRLALDKSMKIDFEDFKTYLGSLSHYLITEHAEYLYSAKYSQIVEFTEKYRNDNKRFVIPVEDIVTLIIEKGILKKAIDDRYTFRLNGVFEYFLAFYMKEDETFRNGAINDPHYYLSFCNEFELYSGFNKKDKVFVENIFNKTESIFRSTNTKYNQQGSTDQILLSKISKVFDITLPLNQIAGGKNAVLSPEKQDELIEEFTPVNINKAEVTQKKFYDEIEATSENLEKALFVLSRVYKNCAITENEFNNKILDFILESACNLGFLLIDESSEGQNGHSEIGEEDNEKALMKLITNFMPLVVETYLFDAIAQNNLERVFKDKIEELGKDYLNNQFKLLILYFMLIDLDLKDNKKYIDEVIEKTTLGILKQTTLLKLYTYLMFKTHNQPALEKFIRERIQTQTKKIDSNSDSNLVDKRMNQQKRIANLRVRSKR